MRLLFIPQLAALAASLVIAVPCALAATADEADKDLLDLSPQILEQLSDPEKAKHFKIHERGLPPGITGRIFVYRIPGKDRPPPSLGTCTLDSSNPTAYGLAGWKMPSEGLTWSLNSATLPSGMTLAGTQPALAAAFSAWTSADSAKKFTYAGQTTIQRPKLDSQNIVMWGNLGSGTIAVTYIRYNSDKVVVDVDTVFNSRYPWYVFAPTRDCMATPVAYDVQDIGTHEFGHWIGLDDLYGQEDKDLTMYGYGAGGELKKRSLAQGDIDGANAVAP